MHRSLSKHMKQFYLAEIITEDKLIHQGIFFKPKKPSSVPRRGTSAGKAILWVHGLTGTFYGNIKIFDAFAQACEKEGWGFASFNNRGHDMVTGARRLDSTNPKGYSHVLVGAGLERFEECIYDIEAGVQFLIDKGFSEVIVVGHSTGAIKACLLRREKAGRSHVRSCARWAGK